VSNVHRMESGLDTGMFSVHQMHPETALRLAHSAGLGGLAKHNRSLQTMIEKYDISLVVVRVSVDYRRELTFLSTPFVVSEARYSIRDDRKLITFRVRHLIDDVEAVVVETGIRPLRLSGGPALDAVPGPVPEELYALFDPDEVMPKSALPTRSLQNEIDQWTAGAECVGEGDRPLFIGRADCEFADQWLGARLPALVASAREQLLFDGMAALDVAVNRPIARFQGEFFRPMFFGDEGVVEVRAYRRADQTMLVHRVLGPPVPGSAAADRPVCALAVERF
jgi:acyl-CoA thioesterase FadM